LLLYYITDRTQFPGDESARRRCLLQKIAEASRCVDFIQLREKDLGTGDLEDLARTASSLVREGSSKTRLLINSRTDVAMACGANGVHLHSLDISPRDVRALWARSGRDPLPVVAVSCHTLADVTRAASDGADFAVFAPVFEKRGVQQTDSTGIETLRTASRQKIPVLALGGVTLENASACMKAGAAGLAGIRLFQENDIAEVVRTLRG
jgi:thiamine-phosphate pyrophosphorylase